MRDAKKLKALQEDVQRACDRVREQKKKDADHEVALAMFNADLQRAHFHLQEYLTNAPHGRLAA